jgi:Leucine-rich repeat (LRR) protein
MTVKYLLLLSIQIFLIGTLSAQNIDFNDVNLENALLGHDPVIDTNEDGRIQITEAENFNGLLDLRSAGISDMSGIEFFVNAIGLECNNNNLTELDLSSNLNLRSLWCNENDLVSLILGANTKLQTLRAHINNLTSIDLSQNTGLLNVNLDRNQLASLDLSNNVNITDLTVRNNHVLSSLDVSHNVLLRNLNCGVSNISFLDVSQNTLLIDLNVSSSNLTTLDLSQNTALQELWIGNNNFSSIDLSANTNLRILECGYNTFTTLDLSNNSALERLSCGNNLITSLDLSGNPALYRLYCTGNLLDEIDLSSNLALREFYFADNLFETVDLSANTALTDIGCQRNNITSLNLSNNILLRELNCNDNKLISLDLSNNTKLEELRCYNNNLTSLNLVNANNHKVTALRTTNNPQLFCIQVDDPTYSTTNWTDIDSWSTFYESCPVYIPDANFKAILLADVNINSNLNDEIEFNEAENYTGIIDVKNASIQDLTGIEAFTNIEGLDISSNDLTEVALSENVTLTILNVSNNNLNGLTLSNLGMLEELYAKQTLINSINLSNNELLRILDMSGSKLVELDLSENSELTNIDLSSNLLNTLNLANSKNALITTIDLTNNPNLGCITVDNPSFSTSNWVNVDETANFSTDCENVETDIIQFSLTEQAAPADINYATHTIELIVNVGTDLTSLTPTITISNGASVTPSSGAIQNFSSGVVLYEVTAENPTVSQIWEVSIEEENVSPTDISLDNNTLDELNDEVSLIGVLSSSDLNVVDAHSYALVDGAGDTNNDLFLIDNNQLFSQAIFDFESKSSYSIRVQTTDNGGNAFSKALIINISDVTNLFQEITFAELSSLEVTTESINLVGESSSGLEVQYESTNESVATVSGGVLTVVGIGSTIITASQVGNSDYAPASNVGRTLQVTKAKQTITMESISDKQFDHESFEILASSSSGLDLNITIEGPAMIDGSVVTLEGNAGEVTIIANQSGNDTYFAAEEVRTSFQVIVPENQEIFFDEFRNDITYADGKLTLDATASSELEVLFTSSDESIAQVIGNQLNILKVGEVEITAYQQGNTYFNPAELTRTLTISKAEQEITLNLPTQITYGDDDDVLDGLASSGLEVSYTSSDNSVVIITDNNMQIVGVGNVVITANQEGNEFYQPAEEVVHQLTVGKAEQTIEFSMDQLVYTFGDELAPLAATSSSGLEVNYESSNEDVITIEGGVLVIVGGGITSISAIQEGNGLYLPAETISYQVEVQKATQTIEFNLEVSDVLDTDIIELTATSSSGLIVEYEVEGPAIVFENEISFTGTGEVIVTAVQLGNNNYEAAEPVSHVLNVSSITSVYEVEQFEFYPNPVKDHLVIHSKEELEIVITTIHGKELFKRSGVINGIDLSELPNDVYLMKVINKGLSSIYKLVKN